MVNKYSGHKILAVEWWAKESKVILNDTRNKTGVDSSEFGLACRNI